MGSISGQDMANSWLLYPLFKLLIFMIYLISHVYDYVTYPVWYFVQKPWRVRQHRKKIHARWDEAENGSLVFHSVVEPGEVNRNLRRYNLNTMEKVFSHAVSHIRSMWGITI